MEWRGRIEGRVLVTGAAGFIGAALSEALLEAGIEVVGFDSLDPYYDPRLKAARLARLEGALYAVGLCAWALNTPSYDEAGNAVGGGALDVDAWVAGSA